MLTVTASNHRYCDGHTRRSFLQIGSAMLGGLTLPNLLRAEQRSGVRSNKSVIVVYLSGGLAHQDSFDLKPEAPAEVRGEFRPIASSVPGIDICELLPLTAGAMERVALIRSIVGLRDEHSSFQNLTGFGRSETFREGYPSFGSMVSRVLGPRDPVVPPFVDLFPTMQHQPYNSPGPGALGTAYAGVKADGEDLASMKLRYISHGQLQERRRLLETFDGLRQAHENQQLAGVDSNYARAFDVLTSSRLVEAMDLTREDPRVRARYNLGSAKHQGDGAPLWNDQLLTARRLIEAGVRCVTVAYGFWDTHGNNFKHLKGNLPVFDQGVAGLVNDLYDRGLDRDVTLLVWGEFGRTPKINKDAGRDHWPRVNGALFSGGGLRTGQVVGSTDALADSAKDRPIHYHDVLATLYHTLGIDPHEFVKDIAERPIPVLPGNARAIRELV